MDYDLSTPSPSVTNHQRTKKEDTMNTALNTKRTWIPGQPIEAAPELDSAPPVRLTDSSLLVQSMEVEGNALEAARDADERGLDLEATVRRMLELGGTLMQHGASSATVDAVASEVDRLIQRVETAAQEQLPAVLDSHANKLSAVLLPLFDGGQSDSLQGQVTDIIRAELRKQEGTLVRAMVEEDGPLGLVRGELDRVRKRQDEVALAINTISERLVASRELADAHDKGHLKGEVFEERVRAIVERTYAPHRDTVEDLSNQLGTNGRKCGDIVVTVSSDETTGRDCRIVVEAKAQRLSLAKALSELDQSAKNRHALASVMVFDSAANAPINGLPLRLYAGNRIVCALEPDGAERLATLPLELACGLARSLALAALRSTTPEIDSATVLDHVDRLNATIEQAKKILDSSRAARRALDRIDGAYETLRNDAHAILDQLAAQLAQPG